MTNKFRNSIEEVGLNYKKEMVKILLTDFAILLVFIALFIFVIREYYILLLAVALIGVIDYLFFNSYTVKKNNVVKSHDEEFIAIISYFQTFIINRHNVYQSFNQLLPFSSLWMKDKIENFLRAIDIDKSVKPFVDFASHFNLGVAKNVMLSIYQMVDQGENSSQLTQFTFLFQSMSENFNCELREKKSKSLGSVTAFPLIGAGAIVIILSISIISVVGEMINVI